VLTVTENGYGKRSDLDEYRLQSRNGKGLIDIKTGDRNGEAVAIEAVTYGDHLLAMSDNGQIMRTRVEEISTVGRNTKGVMMMTWIRTTRSPPSTSSPRASTAARRTSKGTNNGRIADRNHLRNRVSENDSRVVCSRNAMNRSENKHSAARS